MNRRIVFFSFLLVFLAKLAEVEYLTRLEYSQYPQVAGSHWANTGGDSFSYIGAMENYLTKGSYFFINEKGDTVRAGRTPHYALPYLLLRQAFSPAVALDLFVLLQIVVESVAAVCVALLACAVTKNKRYYFASLGLSVIGLYITVWSYNTFTDAVSANLLLIAAYVYYNYQRSRSQKTFFWFSVLFAVVVCLRPYFSLLYVAVGLAEWFSDRRSIKNLSTKLALTALPLVLLLLPWVVRNFQVMNRLILFQQDLYAGYAVSENDLTIRKTLLLTGEEGGTWWDKKTAAAYFFRRSAATATYTYPAYIRNDPLTRARFEDFRNACLDSNTSGAGLKQQAARLLHFYQKEHPVRYYAYNRVKPVFRFLFSNGSYRLPLSTKQPTQVLVKWSQSSLYYCYLIFGAIGLVQLARNSKRCTLFLIPTAYLILLFPIFFGLTEWRYFLPFYLFHQIGLLYFLCRLRHRHQRRSAATLPIAGEYEKPFPHSATMIL